MEFQQESREKKAFLWPFNLQINLNILASPERQINDQSETKSVSFGILPIVILFLYVAENAKFSIEKSKEVYYIKICYKSKAGF